MFKKYIICYDKIKTHPDFNFLASKFDGIFAKQMKNLVNKKKKLLKLVEARRWDEIMDKQLLNYVETHTSKLQVNWSEWIGSQNIYNC